MAKVKLTYEQVRDTLRAVADESPDYIYEYYDADDGSADICRYVHGDRPGCIVGHVLHRLGVPLGMLSRREGMSAATLMDELVDTPRRAVWLLTDAQNEQDNGRPWGTTVDMAIEDLDNRTMGIMA